MEPAKKKEQSDTAAFQATIKQLEEQVLKLTDIAGRAQADLQNAKARLMRDQDDMRKFAGEMVIMKLLPVIDHLQRAFQHLPEELKQHEWVKGIVAIEQDLLRHFADLGLKRMSSLGESVDPNKHEVLLTGPGEEGNVIDVVEEGYELHGKVLRPAKVKAGQGSAETPDLSPQNF